MTKNTEKDNNHHDLTSSLAFPEEQITHVHQSHLNSIVKELSQHPDQVIHINAPEKNNNPLNIEQRKNMIVASLATHLGFDENNLTKEQSEQIMRTVIENSQRTNSELANVAQDLIINSTLTNYKFPSLNIEGFDKIQLSQSLTEENIAEQLKGVESKISSIRDQAFVNFQDIKKPTND